MTQQNEKPKGITRPQALSLLFKERAKDRGSMSGVKSVVRACKALGFSYAELISTLSRLDYCDDSGKDYGWNAERAYWESQNGKMPGDRHV